MVLVGALTPPPRHRLPALLLGGWLMIEEMVAGGRCLGGKQSSDHPRTDQETKNVDEDDICAVRCHCSEHRRYSIGCDQETKSPSQRPTGSKPSLRALPQLSIPTVPQPQAVGPPVTIKYSTAIDWGSLSGRSGHACLCGFDLFDPVSRRSRSIRPRFVREFPLERNDRHRAASHGHWSPRLAIKQAGRQPLRTKCLTDLARSKAQEPDRLCVARRADPPDHVHGRGSQPPDTPRRSRGRERDHAALRYTLPALWSQTHLQETP